MSDLQLKESETGCSNSTAGKRVLSLIGGKWLFSAARDFTNVFNPSSGQIIASTPMGGLEDVEAAVAAAKAAFANWSVTPAPKRSAILFKYRELLELNFRELAQIITRENGKTLDEAKGDMRRGIEVVEFACGISHLSKGESLPQVADQIDAMSMREPIGVCAGITPFNFPAMVPMWMYPLAIACGNTFILKPSEKVPLTAIRLGELFQEAGLPDGVLNIIHGGSDVVDAICTHPGISAISFVGSSQIAKHVYTLGTSCGKRVQAAGGAKNVLLIMPDADEDSTMRAVLGSAYGCAGQRCMAGSILMAIGDHSASQWRNRLSDALSKLKLRDTSAYSDADMGPVIDGKAQNRIRASLEGIEEQGVEIAYNGREQEPESGFFVGPVLLDRVTPSTKFFREELFGPVLSLVRPKTLDEAIAMMNRMAYGNGATIFTSNGSAARQFVREIQCGMIGVNIGVPAPMALFSFSGWNDSFYGDLHVQGMEGIYFYSRQKMVLSRWDKTYVRQQGW